MYSHLSTENIANNVYTHTYHNAGSESYIDKHRKLNRTKEIFLKKLGV